MEVWFGDDVKCPHCGRGLEIGTWGTEYEDPILGTHKITCPACLKDFWLTAYTVYEAAKD